MDLGWPIFVEWLNKWQTLISGVSAVIAAGFSIRFLSKQIRQADAHERARQRRRHAAARATLPLTLSQICAYAEKAVREMEALQSWLRTSSTAPRPTFSPPELRPDMSSSLERMIEASDDPKLTKVLSDIIIQLQVLAANLEYLAGEEGGHRSSIPNIDSYFVRAATIYAYASHLFPYARGEDECIAKFDAALETVRALKLLRLNELQHAKAFELAQRLGTKSATRTPSPRAGS